MTFIKVAKVAELKSGEKKRIKMGENFVLLAMIGHEYFAVSDTCTHRAASLCGGTLMNKEIECPWHGAKYSLETGKPSTLPAVLPLKKYTVKIEGEDILIKE